jgi:hypothetical protein
VRKLPHPLRFIVPNRSNVKETTKGIIIRIRFLQIAPEGRVRISAVLIASRKAILTRCPRLDSNEH